SSLCKARRIPFDGVAAKIERILFEGVAAPMNDEHSKLTFTFRPSRSAMRSIAGDTRRSTLIYFIESSSALILVAAVPPDTALFRRDKVVHPHPRWRACNSVIAD